ncbi:unnamed protein product [Callosobruchus maculatus]|uniref:O-acyltransferase WSD1 C-terminal domain-containing protein n=1 Tax=Callosobruchus maculatus TaxID=64391 RepID=A0A653BL28_CALMS|nr:unnamed protein product [Callosobruchus maculatus]
MDITDTSRSTSPKYAISPKLAKNELLAIPLFIISLILFIILAPVLILFAILRIAVSLILKQGHGKNYGGLVEREATWLKTADMPLINIVTILHSKISSPEALLSHLKQCLLGPLSQSNAQKLTSVCNSFMGYAYYLNNQVTIDDICNTIAVDGEKEFLDKNVLTDILGDLASRAMPKGNSGLFEVLVVNKPLKKVDNDTYKYAVIFRVNHIVADGIALTNFFLQSLADDQGQLKRSFKELVAKFDASKTKKANTTGWQRIIQILRHIKMFMVYLPIILANSRSSEDRNCLHGPNLSGKKISVYAAEKKGEGLMLAVKQIKRRVTGSTFSSVVLTAISRVIGRHMLKKEDNSPNFVNVMMTALFSIPNMEETPILANYFSLAKLDMPLFRNSEDVNCQIGLMEKYWNEVKEKPDFLVNYLVSRYLFGVLPIPLLKQLFDEVKITMSVSNLPGVPKLRVLEGQQVEQLVFFTHNHGTMGVSFTIMTYDNKFQIGLTIDTVFDCTKEEAQSLVHEVLKEIREMHKELDFGQLGLSKSKGLAIDTQYENKDTKNTASLCLSSSDR